MSIQPSHPRSSQQIVADNLAAELARKRLSGRAAALALGLNHIYVARRVKGEVELSVSDIVAFSDLLDIDPGVLFTDAKKAPAPKGGGQSANQYTPRDSNPEPNDSGLHPISTLHSFPVSSADETDTGDIYPVTQLRA